MFKDKSFNLAFLVSLSWHLFLMLFVTIVILPANFKMAKTSTVSFLGPLLEKTAFELMLEQKIPTRQVLFTQPMYPKTNLLSYNEKGLNGLKFDTVFSTPKTEDIEINTRELFGDFKFTPSFQQAGLDIGRERTKQDLFTQREQENFFIEGPLANREILFKPELPAIPKRVEEGQDSFVVELKFELLPDGRVGDVCLLASSGYPDIDLIAINYVTGFKFSPLDSGAGLKEKSVRGKIRLNLKSR